MPLSSPQYRMRRLFTEDFNAADLADPCLSFDAERSASAVREVMVRMEATVAGVRVDGLVAGYVRRDDLGSGTVADVVRTFGAGRSHSIHGRLSRRAGCPRRLRDGVRHRHRDRLGTHRPT